MKHLCVLAAVAAIVLASCTGAESAQGQAPPTEKPVSVEKAQPQPGATFSGPIDISGEHASGGTLTFSISADGSSIGKVTLRLTDFKCEGVSAGSAEVSQDANTPITDGIDLSLTSIGEIRGRFDSATSASGTIHIKQQMMVGAGSFRTCDMGSWDWSAAAE